MEEPRGDDPRSWNRFLGVGINLAAAILGGFFLGWWADKKYGTAPWLMLVGIVLGFVVGFYQFIKETLRA